MIVRRYGSCLLVCAAFWSSVSLAQTPQPSPIYASNYGMRCDGSTDDTAALSRTISAASSVYANGPAEIILPPGRCIIAGQSPSITTAFPIAVSGSGSKVTSLIFSSSDGFDITETGGTSVIVRDMSILTANTTATYSNTGLNIVFSGSGGRPLLRDLDFGDASGSSTHGWLKAINLAQPVNGDLDDIRILMPAWTSGSTSGSGISLAGSSTSAFAIDNQMTHVFAVGGYQGISIGAFVQGLYITDPVLVGNDYGIYWDGSTSGDVPELLALKGGEFNNHAAGVYAVDATLSHLVGNHFFHYLPSVSGAWSAVDFEGGNNIIVASNVIYGANTSNENGIVLDNLGQTPNVVSANSIGAIAGYGIWFKGTTKMSISSGNSINGPNTSSAVQDDSGGFNLRGPVIYNGNQAPFYDDGVNFGVNTAIIFPKSGVPSGVLSADSQGGLQVTNTSGSGGLTIQGTTRALGNVVVSKAGSVITQDSSGNSAYISATSDGVLAVGTLHTGVNAGIEILPGTAAGVPGCASSNTGEIKVVTDAKNASYGAVYAGGGSAFALLACNGSSWVVH